MVYTSPVQGGFFQKARIIIFLARLVGVKTSRALAEIFNDKLQERGSLTGKPETANQIYLLAQQRQYYHWKATKTSRLFDVSGGQ